MSDKKKEVRYIAQKFANAILSDASSYIIAPDGLQALNAFLDEFLFILVDTAKGLETNRIKSAVYQIFPTPLGKNAIVEAELEAKSYLDMGGKDAGLSVPGSNGAPSPNLQLQSVFNADSDDVRVEQVFEQFRAKCQYYSKLGERLGSPAGNPANGIVIPTLIAIYVTAVLEHVAEYVLQVSSQVADRQDHADMVTVREVYMALQEDRQIESVFETMILKSQLQKRFRNSLIMPGTSGRAVDSLDGPIVKRSGSWGKQLRLGNADKPKLELQLASDYDDQVVDPNRPQFGDWDVPPDEESKLKKKNDFEMLFSSGETMKVSLTPNRLRTIEVHKKSTAAIASRSSSRAQSVISGKIGHQGAAPPTPTPAVPVVGSGTRKIGQLGQQAPTSGTSVPSGPPQPPNVPPLPAALKNKHAAQAAAMASADKVNTSAFPLPPMRNASAGAGLHGLGIADGKNVSGPINVNGTGMENTRSSTSTAASQLTLSTASGSNVPGSPPNGTRTPHSPGSIISTAQATNDLVNFLNTTTPPTSPREQPVPSMAAQIAESYNNSHNSNNNSVPSTPSSATFNHQTIHHNGNNTNGKKENSLRNFIGRLGRNSMSFGRESMESNHSVASTSTATTTVSSPTSIRSFSITGPAAMAAANAHATAQANHHHNQQQQLYNNNHHHHPPPQQHSPGSNNNHTKFPVPIERKDSYNNSLHSSSPVHESWSQQAAASASGAQYGTPANRTAAAAGPAGVKLPYPPRPESPFQQQQPLSPTMPLSPSQNGQFQIPSRNASLATTASPVALLPLGDDDDKDDIIPKQSLPRPLSPQLSPGMHYKAAGFQVMAGQQPSANPMLVPAPRPSVPSPLNNVAQRQVGSTVEAMDSPTRPEMDQQQPQPPQRRAPPPVPPPRGSHAGQQAPPQPQTPMPSGHPAPVPAPRPPLASPLGTNAPTAAGAQQPVQQADGMVSPAPSPELNDHTKDQKPHQKSSSAAAIAAVKSFMPTVGGNMDDEDENILVPVATDDDDDEDEESGSETAQKIKALGEAAAAAAAASAASGRKRSNSTAAPPANNRQFHIYGNSGPIPPIPSSAISSTDSVVESLEVAVPAASEVIAQPEVSSPVTSSEDEETKNNTSRNGAGGDPENIPVVPRYPRSNNAGRSVPGKRQSIFVDEEAQAMDRLSRQRHRQSMRLEGDTEAFDDSEDDEEDDLDYRAMDQANLAPPEKWHYSDLDVDEDEDDDDEDDDEEDDVELGENGDIVAVKKRRHESFMSAKSVILTSMEIEGEDESEQQTSSQQQQQEGTISSETGAAVEATEAVVITSREIVVDATALSRDVADKEVSDTTAGVVAVDVDSTDKDVLISSAEAGLPRIRKENADGTIDYDIATETTVQDDSNNNNVVDSDEDTEDDSDDFGDDEESQDRRIYLQQLRAQEKAARRLEKIANAKQDGVAAAASTTTTKPTSLPKKKASRRTLRSDEGRPKTPTTPVPTTQIIPLTPTDLVLIRQKLFAAGNFEASMRMLDTIFHAAMAKMVEGRERGVQTDFVSMSTSTSEDSTEVSGEDSKEIKKSTSTSSTSTETETTGLADNVEALPKQLQWVTAVEPPKPVMLEEDDDEDRIVDWLLGGV